jgi:RNA polymerase sigma-70 factor (ECF subfamily)
MNGPGDRLADPLPEAGELAPLLAAARGGSAEALGHLLELCRHHLLGVAKREIEPGLRAKAGASDLVQDAFVEAHRIFERFQGQTADELLAWLRAILLNKLADFSRRYRQTAKRRVGQEVVLDGASDGALADPEPSPSGVASQAEQSEALRLAMDRLPEHYRQVLIWREWEDLPFGEIAQRLGRTVDATRMLWWRALERLQKELQVADDGAEPPAPRPG